MKSNLKPKELPVVIHRLKNGATVIGTSNHSFKFSDGTEASAQISEVVDMFTLSRVHNQIKTIKGMAVNSVNMILSKDQQSQLLDLSSMADIVIIPFPMLTALREQGLRHLFGNCVAFNATPETQRAAPSDKIVDVTAWSW